MKKRWLWEIAQLIKHEVDYHWGERWRWERYMKAQYTPFSTTWGDEEMQILLKHKKECITGHISTRLSLNNCIKANDVIEIMTGHMESSCKWCPFDKKHIEEVYITNWCITIRYFQSHQWYPLLFVEVMRKNHCYLIDSDWSNYLEAAFPFLILAAWPSPPHYPHCLPHIL